MNREPDRNNRPDDQAQDEFEEAEPSDDGRGARPAPPVVTLAILAIIGAIFVWMFIAGHGDVERVALQFGAKDDTLIRQGQYWRLVTPIFLHAGLIHVLVNSISLYQLGGSMERIYGRKKYLLIFLVSGIAGNFLSFILSPRMSVGASGALFGMVGAGLVFPIRFRNLISPEARSSILKQLAGIAVLNLAIGFSLQGIIDNWAHVGGLLGGAFAALFLIPDVLERRPRSRVANAVVTAFVIAAGTVTVASAIAQWNWARSGRSDLVTYFPVGSPAWWCISVPNRWKFAAGFWSVPEGATISVAEQIIAPNVTRIEMHLDPKTPAPTPIDLDGRPGWLIETPNTQQYQVPVFGRIFDLVLQSKGKPLSAKAKSDFKLVTQSVRFIFPPIVPVSAPAAQRP